MNTRSRLATIGHQIFGLFVDDGAFAITVLVWIAAVWLLLPHVEAGLGMLIDWRPVLFVAGLVLILAGSALRAASKTVR